MFEIVLIRHAETDNNTMHKFSGITDVGLNDNGRQQALKLADALKDEIIDHIFSSDMRRCVETGNGLRCANERIFTKELREMNFGRWENLTYKEIKERYPDDIEMWERDWTDYEIPEGESFTRMSARVIKEFEDIVKVKSNGAKKIAVVSHSGCIRTILGHYIIGSIKDSWRFRVENAAVTRLSVDKGYYFLKSLNEK
ncbi:MAG: histidine phosphatase family protein [Spirochaetota bacterium]